MMGRVLSNILLLIFKMKVIKIQDADYKQLNTHKIHPRQPMWEIIKNLIENNKKPKKVGKR